jgi:hypothetical protein
MIMNEGFETRGDLNKYPNRSMAIKISQLPIYAGIILSCRPVWLYVLPHQ